MGFTKSMIISIFISLFIPICYSSGYDDISARLTLVQQQSELENGNISSSIYLGIIKHQYQQTDPNFLSTIKLIYGTGHLLFFSVKEKNITQPSDLDGKKIAVIVEQNKEMFEYAIKFYSEKNNMRILPELVHHLDYISFDCIWGKPTDYYDVFVTDIKHVQRTIMGISLTFTLKEILDWDKLVFIPELTIPTFIKFTNRLTNYSYINQELNKFINNQIVSDMKLISFVNNMYQLQYMFGNGGFLSKLDHEFLNYYFETKLEYFQKNDSFNFDPLFNRTLVSLDQIYCYIQGLDYHVICNDDDYFNHILGYEISNHFVVFCGVLYYISLLTVCRTNTIKRRLLTPYILPVMIMFNADFYSTYTDYTCTSLRMVFLIGAISIFVGVYGFTLVRFYYLRNLYFILQKIPEKFIKVNKFLSSTGFGIVASLSSGAIHSIIWITYVVVYHFPREQIFSFDPEPVFTGVFLILSSIACLIGIIFMGIDMLVNWRKIKLKGLVHFLTFEDPYHVRLDILTYIGIIVLIVSMLIIGYVENSSVSYVSQGILRSIAFVLLYFLCGWTAIVMEWIGFFRRRRDRKRENSSRVVSEDVRIETVCESTFEDFVKIDSFFDMFKSFSEKEFSLENSLLYERMQQLERGSIEGMILFKDVEILYQTFFQSYSIYEVNVSNKARRDVEALYLSKKDVLINDLKTIIEFDLLMNMKDTFERLRLTGEFKRWNISKTIQSMQSV